jgi:hypothetical protein
MLLILCGQNQKIQEGNKYSDFYPVTGGEK